MNALNWFILFVISAMSGSFAASILDNIMQSIWIPRICGGLVAALVGFCLYLYFTNEK
ncbi:MULTISPECIES: hypothetical protein [Staphylococcus]|uniref:Uncharacterized protein n=1 Tax=Staphylococcus canis TaxID=2724942 RepID=A0ABS0TE09_9STAP|nr:MULTISPECIES: hypothetical protein [Staphylococcus]MBI5975994.1 hypothetical protein [Staphylococcus canis]UXR76294.1 hypothetical protein MUA74_00285 [Staphylococcus sp. IVB6233]